MDFPNSYFAIFSNCIGGIAMNKFILGLTLSPYCTVAFAQNLDLRLLSLGSYNTPTSFYAEYLHSKRDLPDAQRLLKVICRTFPEFNNLSTLELKELVLSTLRNSELSIHIESTSSLLDNYFSHFAANAIPLTEADFSNNDELPTGIILGLIEIGCGALLLLTPFKKIGSGLVVDGSRRIFNDLDAIDKSRHSPSKVFEDV